jgi:hypothetical protein
MESVMKESEGKKKYGEYDDYEIESAVRTLKEAEEIKADASKMKYVKMCMGKEKKAMEKAYKSISDMREDYKNLPDDEEEEY